MTKFGGNADLSELHQAWFVYKDPRKNYIQTLTKLGSNEHPVLDQEGYAYLSVHFLSGIEAESETSFPYGSAGTVSAMEALTKGRYPENYPHPVRLSDAYELGYVYPEDTSLRNIIKNLVHENGAIEAAFHYNSRTSTLQTRITTFRQMQPTTADTQ